MKKRHLVFTAIGLIATVQVSQAEENVEINPVDGRPGIVSIDIYWPEFTNSLPERIGDLLSQVKGLKVRTVPTTVGTTYRYTSGPRFQIIAERNHVAGNFATLTLVERDIGVTKTEQQVEGGKKVFTHVQIQGQSASKLYKLLSKSGAATLQETRLGASYGIDGQVRSSDGLGKFSLL